MTGPGHGGPAVVATAWLEGTYTERFPEVTRDVDGMRRLFRQFSFPGGIPSHAAPETPGSMHEGGELGYSLAHAYGAALDNPDLLVACVIGDGEAETGALAASWHANKFLDPVARRHRAADPAPERLQDRQPDGAVPDPRRGVALRCCAATGTRRIVVEIAADEDHLVVHRRMAGVMDEMLRPDRRHPGPRRRG